MHEQRTDGNTTTYTYFRGLQKGKFAHYSMVLTGEAFIHISYLRMFTESIPEKAKDMIDSLQNCEDITMNVMVAHLLAQSGHPQCSGLRLMSSARIRNLERQSSELTERQTDREREEGREGEREGEREAGELVIVRYV